MLLFLEISNLRMDPLCCVNTNINNIGYCYSQNSLNIKNDFLNEAQSIYCIKDKNMNIDKFEIKNMIKGEKLPFLMFGPNQQPSCVVSHLASGTTISNRQLLSFKQNIVQNNDEKKV